MDKIITQIKFSLFLLIIICIGLLVIVTLAGCFKIYPQEEKIAEGQNINPEETPPGEPLQERPQEPPPGEPPQQDPQANEQQNDQEPPPEEPKPEEFKHEDPPPEETKKEEPKKEEPKTTQPKLSEQEIMDKCFKAAQYQIEHHSIYKNVVFLSKCDPTTTNKVPTFENKYECDIVFNALDTNVNKNGWFVWVFVVIYNPDVNSCSVESGFMLAEKI